MFLDLQSERFGEVGGHLEVKQGEIKTSNPVVVTIHHQTHGAVGAIQNRDPGQGSTSIQEQLHSNRGMVAHLEAISTPPTCAEVTSQQRRTAERRGRDSRTDDTEVT